MAFHRSSALAAIAAKRHIINNADGRDSGLTAQFVHQSFREREAGRGRRIFFPNERDLPGENVVGAESWRNLHRTLEAEPEQSGSRQQYK